jgi:hypothetical protein
MGAEHTDLVVLDQGRLWLRTINIGGNHFTDALAKSFKQSFSKAEGLKKQAATSKYQKQIYQAMRPIFSDLVAEIQRSIGHYNSSHRDSRLERIVCMGNPFKLPNLQKYLQQELKMEVLRLEAFSRANVEKAAAFSEDILALTAAYGLAVQALGMAPINSNLLPTEIARKMMWKQKQPWFIGAAAVVALGAVGIGAQYWLAKSAYAGQENLRDTNNHDYTQLMDKINAWSSVPDTFSTDQAKIDAAMKLAENREFWPKLMLDIYGALPQAGKQTGNPGPMIVINKITSDYVPVLSSMRTDAIVSGQAGTPAPTGAPGDTTAAPPALGPGESDHGFIVMITGYATSPNLSGQNYSILTKYSNDLMSRAKLDPKADPKVQPYYFTDPAPAGKQVPMGGAGGGMGGGMFGGGGGGPGAAGYTPPWGNGGHGEYWAIFAPEITGIRPPQPGVPGVPPAPGMPGGMFGTEGGGNPNDVPPLDLVTKTPTGAKPLAGAYQFRLAFKVHVK